MLSTVRVVYIAFLDEVWEHLNLNTSWVVLYVLHKEEDCRKGGITCKGHYLLKERGNHL